MASSRSMEPVGDRGAGMTLRILSVVERSHQGKTRLLALTGQPFQQCAFSIKGLHRHVEPTIRGAPPPKIWIGTYSDTPAFPVGVPLPLHGRVGA